jgi:hypothetical protein
MSGYIRLRLEDRCKFGLMKLLIPGQKEGDLGQTSSCVLFLLEDVLQYL